VQLIVGLGNPGAQYERTRHNAGFWLVERLAAQCGAVFKAERRYQAELAQAALGGQRVTLLKPTTFMNASGSSVGAYANYFRIPLQAVLVAHDDLDLAPGTVRLKRGGGHGGHNGLRDITATLGADFARLRIGIGHPGTGGDVVAYVLGIPSAADRTAIDAAVTRAVDTMPLIVDGRFDLAMNRLNRRAPAGAAADPE
jgi:PTH1 family peptidyl-tRNA hydrolase